MTARRCSCEPWAPDHECPRHGDDEHRIVDEPQPEPCCPMCAASLAPDGGCTRCPYGPPATPDPWATGPMPPPPF